MFLPHPRLVPARRRPLPLVLAALVLLAGCGAGSDSAGSSSDGLPDEIVIGAAIGKTGYMAGYDTVSIRAVEQLIKETNARGGIDGHPVRMSQADTRSDPQQAVIATQKVIEDGADVLLFTGEALTAAAGSPLAEEHNMLNFTLSENAPGFGPPTTGRLSFSANPSLLSEAAAGASFLHDRGVRRPFLLRDTSLVYGKAHCSAFQQAWEHLGGTIAASADFKNEDASIAGQVSELKRSDADALVACSYPPGGAAAVKQVRAAGIDFPVLGPSAFDGTFWLEGIPNTDRIYVTSNGSPSDPPNPATGKLLKRFQRAGIETDVSTNLLAAYAAGQLILAAIEETGGVDGDALADALEGAPHRTIFGEVSYSEDDHYPSRVWPVYTFADGRQRLVTQVEPEFVPEYGG